MRAEYDFSNARKNPYVVNKKKEKPNKETKQK